MIIGYLLEAQMRKSLVPALLVGVHLMIILHGVDVDTAECLFWSAIVARHDL